MKSYINSLFTCLLLMPLSLFSQTDKQIKHADILPSIPTYIEQHFSGHSKVYYYAETINDTVYCEAIFKFKKDEISLLFDKSGVLYGTEIVLSFKELPYEIKETMSGKLKELFTRYEIYKTEELDLKGNLMYELFLEGKTKESFGYFEVYFDRKGQFIKVLRTELVTIPSMF